MANSILKLRIDDQEYNAKLKNAVQGLQHLNEVAHKGAGELTGLEKSEVDFIKALGDMETKSRSAAGKTRELESAFKELKVIYDNLNEVEKADEGGKALVKSLDTLKQRAQEARARLNEATEALKNSTEAEKESGTVLDQLSQKFTINFDAVKLFNTALKAADGAMQVAKDAFFASEATVDEWGRTVESSRSLYEGFLTALNNSDISGYLTRMDQIVEAARAAYNELDRLGTMKTIQGPAMSAQQAENDRMRQMIMTGRYIAPVDGRNAAPGMVNGQRLTAEQIRAIERNLQGGMQKIVTLVGNEVKQTSKAIDARYSLMAKENGMTLKEFRQGTSSMAEFDKRIKAAAEYDKYERAHTTTSTRINPTSGDAETVILRDNTKNPYEAYKNWGTFRVDKMGTGSYNDLVNLIRQRDQQAAQAYSMQSQAYRTINRAEGTTVRDIMNGKTGSSGGGGGTGGKNVIEEIYPEGSMKELQQELQNLKKAQDLVTSPDDWQKYQQQIDEVTGKMNALKGAVKEVPMATGESGLTPKAVSTYQNMLQESMKGMEYGSVDFTETFANSLDVNALSSLLTISMKQGIDLTKEQLAGGTTMQDLWNQILSGENIDDSVWQELVTIFNEKIEEAFGEDGAKLKITFDVDDKQIKNLTKTTTEGAQDTQKAWGMAAQSVNNMGNALAGIEDPGAKAAGTVIKAISDIALGFAQASHAADVASSGWGWLAWMAAGTAAMATTISTVHSLTGFAEGGEVKGNTFSGDQIPVAVNAGEVILTRAQQGNLAEQLEDRESIGGIGGTPYVTGEQIYLGLNNYLKGAGLGSLVTSNG